MKRSLVILDGYTLNPGDLDWSPLISMVDSCNIHERTALEDIVDRAHDAEMILTNKTPISVETMVHCPRLKYIGVLATGYNIVDFEAAKARSIPVTNVPAYGTRSVAQMTMALLLELTQRVGVHSESVMRGDWMRCPDFCYWHHPLIELEGLTMGIVGYGRIGQAVAEMAQSFGMNIQTIARDSWMPDDHPEVKRVDFHELIATSDVISLHCPLTPETQFLISEGELARMKPSAFLLNTSRGPLIDERALADALMDGKIAGAGIDVVELEPPRTESLLYQAPNCFITPHIAWATSAARKRLMQTAIENVQGYLSGQLQHVVNP